MRPDVVFMCFAALMALFSERSRNFCLSGDAENFLASFGLLTPAIMSLLLLGDGQDGDGHNLKWALTQRNVTSALAEAGYTVWMVYCR